MKIPMKKVAKVVVGVAAQVSEAHVLPTVPQLAVTAVAKVGESLIAEEGKTCLNCYWQGPKQEGYVTCAWARKHTFPTWMAPPDDSGVKSLQQIMIHYKPAAMPVNTCAAWEEEE